MITNDEVIKTAALVNKLLHASNITPKYYLTYEDTFNKVMYFALTQDANAQQIEDYIDCVILGDQDC